MEIHPMPVDTAKGPIVEEVVHRYHRPPTCRLLGLHRTLDIRIEALTGIAVDMALPSEAVVHLDLLHLCLPHRERTDVGE